jgi:chemotaxis signal transduction protein
MTGEQKFLLFPLAGRQCAIPAEQVAELTAASTVHSFPHRSPGIAGVILRQGRVIPLYRLASLMPPPAKVSAAMAGEAPLAAMPGATAETALQYQVIVVRQFSGASERAAFNVDGPCDLVTAALLPASAPRQAVAGELRLGGKSYTVLNLDKLFSTGSPTGGVFAPQRMENSHSPGAPSVPAGVEAESEA